MSKETSSTVSTLSSSKLVGRLVKICGIISKPQLNGRLATCIEETNGRYKCILASSSINPDDESQAVEIEQWQTKTYKLKGSNLIDQATINMENLKAQAQEQKQNVLVESSATSATATDVSREEIMNASPKKLVELIELSVSSHGNCMICAERLMELAITHEVDSEVMECLMINNNGHRAKIIIDCLLTSFLLTTHTNHTGELMAESAILQCVQGMSNGFASFTNRKTNIPKTVNKIKRGEYTMEDSMAATSAMEDTTDFVPNASGLKFRESLRGLALNTMLSNSGFLETMAQRLDDLHLSTTDFDRVAALPCIHLITTICLGNDGKNGQGCQGEAGEGNARRNAASAAGCIESIVRLVRRIATEELPVVATATTATFKRMPMIVAQLSKCLDRICCGHDAEAINRCYRAAALGFVPFAVQAFSRFYSEEAMGWALTCCNTLGKHDTMINHQWETAMSETSNEFQQMIQDKVEAKMKENMAMNGCPTQ